jgi:MurNAc alpha-1-phosphate uridylyltransferase
MVLGCRHGTRMPAHRPHAETAGKVAGKALLDHVLDRLAEAGVGAVVNVHHCRADDRPSRAPHSRASRSRTSAVLLDTGGGVLKALPELGEAPFFHLNADTIWIDGVKPNLARLAEAFDAASMDALLLLAPTAGSVGYAGRGDFAFAADGTLRKRAEREVAPFVYAGAAILTPALFACSPPGAFSLTTLFERAADAGRLHGLRLEGLWMHVGTPDAIAAAEAAIKASAK